MAAAAAAGAAMSPEEAVKILKGTIECADKALDLYNKFLDTIIPWKEFNEIIAELDKYIKDYSDEAGELVGQVKTLLMNAMDAYFLSTQAIYEWCDVAADLLTNYLDLLKKGDASTADDQKKLLMTVLEKGLLNMNAAQVNLADSSSKFNDTVGKLSSLETRLSNDFDANSAYYKQKVNELRTKAYAGAASGAIFGVFGLEVSHSIAAVIVEGHQIPALNEKMEFVKTFYSGTKEQIEKANGDIATTKVELENEIVEIGRLKPQTEKVHTYLPMESLRSVLEKAMVKLVAGCNEFMERHGKKK